MLSYVNITTGHKKAAHAVWEAFKTLYPKVEILEIDPLGFYPQIKNILEKVYFKIVQSNPYLWDYLYDNEMIVKFTAQFRRILNSLNSIRLNKFISSFNPQVVVCTHAFACGIFSGLKERKTNGFYLVGVITDFDVHNYWIYENVSCYIVANEHTAKKLQKKGIDEKRIKILGIPIDPKFTEDKDVSSLREKYGLKEELPTILVMGGGWGFGPIEKIVHCLQEIKNIEFQILVVAGTNKELESKLRELTSKLPKLTKVFGYVDVIDELMKVSNIFIGKPGGMTSAESLACGLPMVIVNPIPGQEERNTQYLTSQGVAIKVNNEFEITKLVSELFTHPHKLKEMQNKILDISKPKSAFQIVETIAKEMDSSLISEIPHL